MFDRITVKEKGKEDFRRNYWPCVLAGFLLSIASGTAISSNSSQTQEQVQQLNYMSESEVAALMSLILGISIIAIILAIFVLNPLLVGCRRFFLVNTLQKAETSEIGFGFKNNYKGMVKSIFLMDLYIGLWSLLLVVPGIIKSYEWRFVPFILSEKPEMDTREAMELSKQMMEGNKMDAFIFDLSFIGWNILSAFTFGLVGLFYVDPYKYASDAELYLTIRSYRSLDTATTVEYSTTETPSQDYTYGEWTDVEETPSANDVPFNHSDSDSSSIYDRGDDSDSNDMNNPFERD